LVDDLKDKYQNGHCRAADPAAAEGYAALTERHSNQPVTRHTTWQRVIGGVGMRINLAFRNRM